MCIMNELNFWEEADHVEEDDESGDDDANFLPWWEYLRTMS